ncbi:hypothetical protein [Neobacillus ginsengisoli]|uniref:Nitroreductase n=1 Tax=Neobacillus ginsengisoli TaxID=904295 RepID=A0ABT9Y1G9_9BACI|nr:hypothetical protein [Neobacillus ginsengisoli]MDQ0201653.1 nitroreductase [Neobacillus ginsengisoli]
MTIQDCCSIEGFDYENVNKILEEQGLLENGEPEVSVKKLTVIDW